MHGSMNIKLLFLFYPIRMTNVIRTRVYEFMILKTRVEVKLHAVLTSVAQEDVCVCRTELAFKNVVNHALERK